MQSLQQVQTLERYTRFYLISGTAMVPLLFIFLGILFYYKFPNGAFSVIFPPLYKSTGNALLVWAGWALSLTVMTALTYLGNRFYVNRLYGRHILKLKQVLEQMAEE